MGLYIPGQSGTGIIYGERTSKNTPLAVGIMALIAAAGNVGAGVRHAVICPNVTGRTKDRIAQTSKQRAARVGSLAIVDY